MDIRPNKFDVDPLPFVLSTSSMPPIFQRWMFKTLHRSFYDRIKKDGLDERAVFPPTRTITLSEWVRAFNFTLTNLVQNGYMLRPNTKAALDDMLTESLTTTVPPKSKRGTSAIDLNRRYQRDPEERVLTTKVERAFATMSTDLADEVTLVQKTREARKKS